MKSAKSKNLPLHPSLPSSILSKADLNDLPLIAWDGPIVVIETEDAAREAVAVLEKCEVLGFDTETRPTFKRGQYYPPALIQLATPDTVYLFRISTLGTFGPFLPILENPDIIKTGVSIRDDVKELQRMEAFQPDGFLDLTQLTVSLGVESRGLRALGGIFLRGRISKGAQVSNWAKPELDAKQITYAATDAWVSREIYLRAKALLDSLPNKEAASA